MVVGLLRGLRVIVRLVGDLANHLSKMLVHLYDMLIVVPLAIEQLVSRQRSSERKADRQDPPWDDSDDLEATKVVGVKP